MRLPIVIATGLVIVTQAYRYFGKGESPEIKSVFSWAFILTILSVLGLTPIANIADIFAYIIIVIILMNDGYDMMRNF